MTEKERLEIREYCRLLRLLQAQVERKSQKAVKQRIHAANFPYKKYLEDLEMKLPETIFMKMRIHVIMRKTVC